MIAPCRYVVNEVKNPSTMGLFLRPCIDSRLFLKRVGAYAEDSHVVLRSALCRSGVRCAMVQTQRPQGPKNVRLPSERANEFATQEESIRTARQGEHA